MESARGVIRSTTAARFWPPAPAVAFADCKPLWFDSPGESVDPALLLKYEELRRASA